MLSRRSFIKALAAVGGVLLLPLDRLGGRVAPVAEAQEPTVGELYEGFLLLPEGASVPSLVKYPALGTPIFGEVPAGYKRGARIAVASAMESEQALAKACGFPIYTLKTLPSGARARKPLLTRYSSGEPFWAATSFESLDPQRQQWETTIGVCAGRVFPRPYPIRSAGVREPGVPASVPEKVSFLPSPGVMVPTARGFVFAWIESEVLYRATIELGGPRDEAIGLLGNLVRVTG